MLIRGADGRLYRVSPTGAVVVTEESRSNSHARLAVRAPAEAGASAEIYGASAEFYTATV